MAARSSFLVLMLCLVASLASGCSGSVASPPWAAAAAACGWTDLVPDLSSAGAAALVAGLKPKGFRDFMEGAYGLILLRDPETAYAMGISKAYGVPEDALTDLSDSHALGTRELYLAIKGEADRRLATAEGEEALALSALSRWLGDKSKDLGFSLDKYPVSPYVNSADQLALDYFTEFRQVRDEDEAQRYIACLSLLPAKMQGLAEALDLRARAGVILPRGIFEYTLRGIREVSDAPARSTPFYEAFERKLAASSVPEGAPRTALLDRAAGAIERYAIPAWKGLADALARQAARMPPEGGAWRLPGGRDYYASCLSRMTTTGMDAARIHELGLKELGRVQGEIRSRFASLGYPKDQSLAQLYARLGREGGSLAGRALLARIGSYIQEMDGRLGEVVLVRPRIAVEAVFGEFGGYYQPPSIDGGRPGRYFVAESDRRYAFDVATTAFHETIPGHHLQIARALEADLPGFLRGADFLGYTEGWALYAERLAFELGFYDKDLPGDLGRLRMESLRAARLVADTGINAMGWTFDQAVNFLLENTGLDEGTIDADVTRYVIDPGQATAYYVGFAEILRLRELGRAALGAKFDLRGFHEAILSHGALPLDLLDKVVSGYIAAEKAR